MWREREGCEEEIWTHGEGLYLFVSTRSLMWGVVGRGGGEFRSSDVRSLILYDK